MDKSNVVETGTITTNTQKNMLPTQKLELKMGPISGAGMRTGSKGRKTRDP
jgi:hypothetical protein